VTDPASTLRQALAASYRVERELGEGGMATVFLATDLKHQRSVAIKVLKPELAYSLGSERFLREIEIAAKLQHPNILPVYDSGEAAGVLYYVMPFVEGESLRERVVRLGALPAVEAVRIAREIADALHYAHGQGIVHRDVKPANILLSQGHAVVADFGIARAINASAVGLTQVGMAVGSPAYMSPEQALGEQNLDGRTDIFALGAILYEMLEGKAPFDGPTPQSIIAQALSDKRRRLTKDPLGVQPVIDRALAREPTDRFASAGEMGAALDSTVTATRPVLVIGRRRAPFIIGGVLAAAVAISALVWVQRGYRPEGDPRKSLIIFPFENRTGDASRDYLAEASMNLLGLATSHWQDMRVYDDERTASLLRRRDDADSGPLDFAAARSMARHARVGTLLLGDIRLEGDSLTVQAKVHDVRTGDRIAFHTVRTLATSDPRPMFDQLAAQILGTSGAPPRERPSVLAQTTTSLESYREYLAGTAALQRFQIDSATAHFQRAITLDTTFALPYLRLREAQGWGFRGSPDRRQEREWVLAAERHSASLPWRIRSLVAFHRAYVDGDFRRARQIVQGMLARDSTDVEAWYQLGEAHFHHDANSVPHPDSLGNLGHALRAFQRSLALDSTYILAYQHIIDALRSCARSNALVCLADSATYGTPDALRQRFGEETLARHRREAREAQIATARGWVSAAPTTERARAALVEELFAQERYDDALLELDGLARTGGVAQAGLYHAQILFMRGQPRDAARALDSALVVARDTLSMINGLNFLIPAGLLAGAGGRIASASKLYRGLFQSLPGDSLVGPGNLRLSKAELQQLVDGHAASEAGTAKSAAAGYDLLRIVSTRTARDSIRRRGLTASFGTSLLQIFLASRDSTILSSFVRRADTVKSANGRVAAAQLALARGDTVGVRARVEQHYRRADPAEFNGDAGFVRRYAWADLLGRSGDLRAAAEDFARLEMHEARLQHPGMVVRSYAERAALHRQLGENERAVELYERFLSAWADADRELEPILERARDAVAGLRIAPGQRTPPGR
jgi:tRNA A-37 threonylcarbamoyl transferase component Bud32/tetratricopeptide (TPR) repeat protein